MNRRIGPKQTRNLQRAAHLVTGAAIAGYIYLTPYLGPAAPSTVRWLILPMLVATGMAMWQWPRIRRTIRRWTASA